MGFSVGMKLVLAAAILMVIGGVLMFILQDGSGDFTDFISGETEDAQCEAGYQEYALADDCGGQDNQKRERIKDEYEDQCDVASWHGRYDDENNC